MAGSQNLKRNKWRLSGLLWLTILLMAFIVQVLTIDVLPHIQQDEAQITDYGRLVLHPESNWSVTWLTGEEKPLLLWSYLGPLIAETSYLLGGSSGIGPRIASLIGGLLAATLALAWLRSRKVPMYAAWCLSLALLLDPLFVLSQRMARVDSWVIACCLGSCWILREVANKSNPFPRWSIMVAGALAGIAELIWPSALFLYPLIALELFYLIKSKASESGIRKEVLLLGLWFILGGIAGIALLLVPVWKQVALMFGDMSSMMSLNIKSSQSTTSRIAQLIQLQPWMKLVKSLVKTFTPFLPLLAIAGALLKREKALILVSLLTAALMVSTLVYEFRVLYLLPYFIALAAGFYSCFDRRPQVKWMYYAGRAALFVIVVWSLSISLVVRPILGFQTRAEMDRRKVEHAAISNIGRGKYRVFLDFTYEFYFAGRSLGWEIYTPYINFSYDSLGNWIRKNDYEPKSKFIRLLSEMDYAIFREESVTKEFSKELAQSGLSYCRTISLENEDHMKAELPNQNRDVNILLFFLKGKDTYGNYRIFCRTREKGSPGMAYGGLK